MTSMTAHPKSARSLDHANNRDLADLMTSSGSSHLSSGVVSHWLNALDRFDQGKLKDALAVFQAVDPKTSKINYNIASIHATLGNYDAAVDHFNLAIESDNYMAISYFQIGVCRFLSGHYRKAARSFNTALKLLRGNSVINYQQLGLEYKLYSCEIMYNRALSYFYSGQVTVGIYDLGFAVKEKRFIPEHSILDEALAHFSQSSEFEQDQQQQQRQQQQQQPTQAEPQQHPEVDIRNMLNIPKNADARSQRFSLLAPPNYKIAALDSLANNNSNTSLNSANSAASSAPEKPSEMVYTLFSVPQGALFRLTDTKVQYILGDKYADPKAAAAQDKAQTQTQTQTPMVASSPSIVRAHTVHNTNASSSPPSAAVPPRKSSMKTPSATPVVGALSGSHHYPRLDTNSLVRKTSITTETYTPHSSANSAASSSNASSFTSIQSSQASPTHSSDSDYSLNTTNKPGHLQAVKEVPVEDPAKQIYPTAPLRAVPEKPPSPVEEPPPRSAERAKLGPAAHIGGAMGPPSSQAQAHMASKPVPTFTDSPMSPESITTPQFSSPDARQYHPGSARSLAGTVSSPATTAAGADAIKVKIHYSKETRVMLVHRGISFTDFRQRIAGKLEGAATTSATGQNKTAPVDPEHVYPRVKDEDGDLVLLGDQEDLDVVLEEVCNDNAAPGKKKLAVFVELMI